MLDHMAAKKNILIIEDDIYLVRAYQIKFEKNNIRVNSVSDGEAAAEFLRNNPKPDAIILDLLLPKTDGFEVLKKIKAVQDWENIPVVIISNLGQESDIEKGRKLGAVDYIVKADTSIQEAVQRVEKLL